MEAAKKLQDILPTLENGRYIPVDMSRANYKKKMAQDGVRNYVGYDVTIGDTVFVLKCTAKKSPNVHNRIVEYPYSFKKKRDE